MEAFLIVEYIGIASASLSGYLFAARRRYDWLGVFISAFLTALGGGILRDVSVGRSIYSFTHYMPLIIVILVLLVSYWLKVHRRGDGFERRFVFIFADAIDFICFSIVGAMVACEFGFNVFGVAFIAFANGVGGGIMRDILLNEVPWFLSTGLYGTISMLVGVIYYFMYLADFVGIYFILLLLVFGVVFRLLAYYKGWGLPEFKR